MAINSVLSTAVSGLHKSAARVRESADTIVNVTSSPPTSKPTSSSFALSGNNAVDAQIIGSQESNLAREIVNLIEARAAYSANAEVIRTADDLSRLTNDILA